MSVKGLVARVPQMVLGLALAYAGVGHLTTSRVEFRAQVPSVFAEYPYSIFSKTVICGNNA